MPSAHGHQRVYRSVSTTRGALCATGLLVGLIVLASVPGKAQIVGYIFAPVWTIGTWRTWRVGVHVQDNGVKVVGALVSKRIAWEEIDHFEVRPWLRYPYQGHVILKSGRAIPILGLGAAGRPKGRDEHHRQQVQGPVDRLNEVLSQSRATSTGERDAESGAASSPSAAPAEGG
jgi:hypothetical protein